MKTLISRLTLVVMLAMFTNSSSASPVSFDFISASPVGSWQLREEIDTNHKGKKTGTTIRTSMVGKEVRDGEDHYWIEMQVESFKIKKNGKRKAKGKRAIMKSLVPSSVVSGDPENVMSNLRGFGVEIIVQDGDEQPVRMSNSGGLLAGAMKMANIEIKHDFESLGEESVIVSGGEFSTKKIQGTGRVTMKVVFKKMDVQSDTVTWVSDDVPFGMVKMQGTTVTNGKTSTQSSELLEYGKTGAESAITQEPRDMPSIANPFS